MDLGIDGRVALVGGASRGIGRAIAAALAAEGARVAITSREQANVDAAAAQTGALLALAWDSADLASSAGLVDAVQERLGPVEILVTNTGGPPRGDPLSFSEEEWEFAHRTLVRAPLVLVQHVLPGMRERGWGRIVNVGSTALREPLAGLMLSNAERAATLGAFATLAREVASDGVTLNTLLTGSIATGSLDPARAFAARSIPAGRLGEPEEMGWAAAFLCSERAAYITGAALAVDGGLMRGVK